MKTNGVGAKRMEKSFPESRSGRIRSFKLLWSTIRATGSIYIFLDYIVFLLVCCLILRFAEPDLYTSFGDAVWCVFQTVTTVGFGDLTPTTLLCRVVLILVGMSGLFMVAFATGVVVNYYSERIHAKGLGDASEIEHRLETLSSLSPEALRQLETNYRSYKSRFMS
ncbi:MAG: potassium channel family protein [Eggerthellaceae bacterium]|nr:potassium channel family protein [Eggerthellaceae bacterium]